MGALVPSDPSPSLDELSEVLWQVRRLLDLLRFRLEEERVLARAGGERWRWTAHREVEEVRDRLRVVELVRAVTTERVAASLGLDAGPTLLRLAAAAPAPWDDILRSHREALVVAAGAVADAAAANERLAATAPEQAPPVTRLGPSLTDFLAESEGAGGVG